MSWEALIYSVVKEVLPWAMIVWTAYVSYRFKKKEKTLDVNIEKPNNVTNVFNITITKNYNNNTELPK